MGHPLSLLVGEADHNREDGKDDGDGEEDDDGEDGQDDEHGGGDSWSR